MTDNTTLQTNTKDGEKKCQYIHLFHYSVWLYNRFSLAYDGVIILQLHQELNNFTNHITLHELQPRRSQIPLYQGCNDSLSVIIYAR